MPIPKNKSELLDAIKTDYAKLRADFEKLPLDIVDDRTMLGHAKDTLMSPKDLAAYLVGWAELVLLWNKQSEDGVEIIFPCEGYKWNELGLLAQQFYNDYQKYEFTILLSLLDQRVAEIIELVELTNDDVLYGRLWYKKYTMGRMIQLNTSSPFKNARKRVRKLIING